MYTVVLPVPGSDRPNGPLLPCGARADWSGEPCSGPAGCARYAEQEATAVRNGGTASKITSGSGVHARHDHASCASGGDDGADSVTYGEQGPAVAGRAHQ